MQPISYARHQFPADIIRHATWLYLRFMLSYRDVEELLAERGIETSGVVTLWGVATMRCASPSVRRQHRPHSAMPRTPQL